MVPARIPRRDPERQRRTGARRCRWLAAALRMALALAALSRPALASEIDPAGADVVDGDSLGIGGEVFQLFGIDAPELGQGCRIGGQIWRCGTDAAFALRKLVAVQMTPLRCAPAETREEAPLPLAPARPGAMPPPQSEQALPARCEIGSKDIALVLLQSGYAIALPEAPPSYQEAMNQARQGGLGLWRGDFVPPSQWRAGMRLPGEESGPDCSGRDAVKGIVDHRGRKYYYWRGDEIYLRLQVDPARGEAHFCSDDAARAAGFVRAPRRQERSEGLPPGPPAAFAAAHGSSGPFGVEIWGSGA